MSSSTSDEVNLSCDRCDRLTAVSSQSVVRGNVACENGLMVATSVHSFRLRMSFSVRANDAFFARGGGMGCLKNNTNCPTPVVTQMACPVGRRWLFRMIE